MAEFLSSRNRLGPEAIGTVAVDELGWVADDGLAGDVEPFSGLGLVDVDATLGAARNAFGAIERLAQGVDPTLTSTVLAGFTRLDTAVAALGPPTAVPESSVRAVHCAVTDPGAGCHRRAPRPALRRARPVRHLRGALMTGRRRPAPGPGAPRAGGPALSRRQLLAGSGMATAAVVAGAALPAAGADTPPSGSTDTSTVPFYGEHQAGVATPEQMDGLRHLRRDRPRRRRARRAARGVDAGRGDDDRRAGAGRAGGNFAPPPDTGEALDLSASRLTVTVGFGPSLFDDRFGLGSRRPGALIDLPAFPGDQLDPPRSGGDLCIQACADDPQVAFHAVHDLTRLALGSATVRSLQVGFGRTAATGAKSPSPRNLLGFRDGTDNLVSTDSGSMDRFVWVDDRTDQSWMQGGTYLVARRIRIHLEEWDRSTLGEQERTIGRTKSTGAPLGGQHEYDPVDLAALAADGTFVVPYDAHIRVASADTNHGAAILRRGYSFADGVDPTSGELDAGLFFICFQKDPASQFVPVQQRLALQDALTRFVLHTGSGIFACPPGVSPGKSWGQGLL